MDIRIKTLHLENFKCHKSLTLDFGGRDAAIYGDNATGKTSVYDALTWLLFGKDSAGNGEKNIDIKPLDPSGNVKDHQALTVVDAVFLVDGEELDLRRTYRELWSTKRGSSETTYDGNTSEYYVDGVPCKRNAFQDRVNQLMNEDTFRMLTSVSYFASGMSWQDRRETLFRVAGVADDQQILQTDQRFLPLVESMGKLSLDGYKKKLLAEKKGFVGAKTEIPARISQCEKAINDLCSLDFAAEKAELEVLNAKKDGIAARISEIEHDSAAEQKRLAIREVQLEITSLEHGNKVFRDAQSAGVQSAGDIRREIVLLQSRLENRKMLLATTDRTISDCNGKIQKSRELWMTINSEVFSGGTCPTCGQLLPEDRRKESEHAFAEQKTRRLKEVEQSAAYTKDTKAQSEKRREELLEDISGLEAQIQDKEGLLASVESQRLEVKDMDDYAYRMQELKNRCDVLTGELSELMKGTYDVKESLRKEMASVSAQISEKMAAISMESLLEYNRKQVEELRQDAKNAAACLEAIEKMLYLMDEYSRYKTRFVEETVNRCFRIAKFRLFREQANGGVEDRCDVVYDGVPYTGLNNGMKINVGIDIINTLSGAYGVSVPLFVDNAEAVTRLEQSNMQMIRLVVSEKDKELRLNHEN